MQVEMFVLCTPEQSDALHQELITIEEEMFTELGLHFKVRARGNRVTHHVSRIASRVMHQGHASRVPCVASTRCKMH